MKYSSQFFKTLIVSAMGQYAGTFAVVQVPYAFISVPEVTFVFLSGSR